MRFLKILLIFLLLFAGSGIVSAGESVKIRVAVLRDVSKVSLAILGPFEIVDNKSGRLLYSGKYLSACVVSPHAQGFKLNDKVLISPGMRVRSRKSLSISIDKRQYRGDIIFLKDSSGTMLVVNSVDLESYVKGVLYHEISHKWPMDAIKAQAVACRTYALYQKEMMKAKDYDVTADTSSQVYGGYGSEQNKTNRAVNFTRGEILKYQGKIFPAYFHATCSGVTENAGELWKIDIEPLQGQKMCSFCVSSPHYEWKAVLNFYAIREKMGALYPLADDPEEIVVMERNSSGRIRNLRLRDRQKEEAVISAKDFRQALGPDVVRSTNFSILVVDDEVVLSGRGWGHGVGLCQWGALGMALAGHTYKEILEFYYPRAKLVKI